MLNSTERLGKKNRKPYQMVSKNYEILTTGSTHLEVDLHQILDPNWKVWPTGHVRHLYRMHLVFSSSSRKRSIQHPKFDQINSKWLKNLQTNPSFSTLELDSSQSINSWEIRWNPSVEGINSRPCPSQIKRTSQNAQKMTNRAKKGGKTRTRRTRTWITKAPHKSNPERHEEVRASIPNQNHRFNYIGTLVHRLNSWEEPREGGNLKREVEERSGKRWGRFGAPSSLFNRAITQSQTCL